VEIKSRRERAASSTIGTVGGTAAASARLSRPYPGACPIVDPTVAAHVQAWWAQYKQRAGADQPTA